MNLIRWWLRTLGEQSPIVQFFALWSLLIASMTLVVGVIVVLTRWLS